MAGIHSRLIGFDGGGVLRMAIVRMDVAYSEYFLTQAIKRTGIVFYPLAAAREIERYLRDPVNVVQDCVMTYDEIANLRHVSGLPAN
jgi:hypothetical protein